MLYLSAPQHTELIPGARFHYLRIILESVYALIAIATHWFLCILRMINFAHGEFMMVGAFGGYFVFRLSKPSRPPTLDGNPHLNFWTQSNPFSCGRFVVGGPGSRVLAAIFSRKSLPASTETPAFVPLIPPSSIHIPGNAGQLLFWNPEAGLFNPVV